MARKPKTTGMIKQIYRLHSQGKGKKTISRELGVSKNTVKKYLAILESLPAQKEDLLKQEDEVLGQYVHSSGRQKEDRRYHYLVSHMDYFFRELQRPGVTRWLLWKEYRQKEIHGYSYSQFCWHLQQWAKKRQVSLPQDHAPGDLLYIDFAGRTFPYVDRDTGEIKQAQVFVGVLGYSQYSYIEAIESQKTQDFIRALSNCLHYFGGVPKGIVPDNLKSAVIKTDRYEPKLNKVLEDFANHYGTAIIPARSRKPKDKSLAETFVSHSYSHIYAPLRDREFHSIGEINEAFKEKLELYNQRRFQRSDNTRASLYESEEKPHLQDLPGERFQIKKYRELKVQPNIHILLYEDKHYYSAPFRYVGEKVRVIYTNRVVDIYYKGEKIASHLRDRSPNRYTTVKEHMPSHYQKYLERSPEYYLSWARNQSREVEQVVETVLSTRPHPEQAYKSCDGIKALARKSGQEKLIRACRKAIEVNACSYTFLKRVIENGMLEVDDKGEKALQKQLPFHSNIRGADYYK